MSQLYRPVPRTVRPLRMDDIDFQPLCSEADTIALPREVPEHKLVDLLEPIYPLGRVERVAHLHESSLKAITMHAMQHMAINENMVLVVRQVMAASGWGWGVAPKVSGGRWFYYMGSGAGSQAPISGGAGVAQVAHGWHTPFVPLFYLKINEKPRVAQMAQGTDALLYEYPYLINIFNPSPYTPTHHYPFKNIYILSL